MLPLIVRNQGWSPLLRSRTNASNIINVAMRTVSSGPRRHISAGGAVEPAHPPRLPHPPYVSPAFDRTKPKLEPTTPAQPKGGSSGGGSPRDTPVLSPTTGISTTSEAAAVEPKPSKRQAKEERMENEFWRGIDPYKDVSAKEFLSWEWSTKNVIETKQKLLGFLDAVLPNDVPCNGSSTKMQGRDYFMKDILEGMEKTAMAVRVMPYVMSRINWKDPANDPIFRQFIPLRSIMMEDHPECDLDSLHERQDSPADAEAIVHRYPDKALFLPVAVCPVNCMCCTRAYGVGADTPLVSKDPFKLTAPRIKSAFAYMSRQEGLHDIVVSGGDAYYLPAHILEEIGDMLIAMPNIRRFRFASKGLAVSPQRFIDPSDEWTKALIRVSDKARLAGKHMALHTHFNHPSEISWITEKASLKLLHAGVIVRNQSVLLRGINDNVKTMSTLIRKLADMAIQPYYIYQCDMTSYIEHLRTPLQTILDMEEQLTGSIAGFYMPKCVVDLPKGGGKRPAHMFKSYDRESGVSTFTSPVLTTGDKAGKTYRCYDPIRTPEETTFSGQLLARA